MPTRDLRQLIAAARTLADSRAATYRPAAPLCPETCSRCMRSFDLADEGRRTQGGAECGRCW